MTLMFASAASFSIRFIEFCGETDFIVSEYIKKRDSPEEQVLQTAWIEAINSIKRHGAWHSGLFCIKIFGDGILFSAAVKHIYEWLYELYLLLRQVYSKPEEELIRETSTIIDRVKELYEKMMKMNKPLEETGNIAKIGVTTVGGKITTDCIDGRLSPTNLLKYLWKFLTHSYSIVVQWLLPLKAHFNFEMTKYTIQLCGCITYYLELLDKVWNFGLN